MLVDDHPMFREHLSQLISRELGMSICGEADNTVDALALIRQTNPDIVLLDITLNGANGLELLKELKNDENPPKVLVLSMHPEELYAERSLRAGARGYITKNEASTEVVKAIRQIAAGEIHVSQKLTSQLLGRFSAQKIDPQDNPASVLADRELEVFQLLGRGQSTRDIATALGLGESTVETYRARIKDKLRLKSSAELYLQAGQWVRTHLE